MGLTDRSHRLSAHLLCQGAHLLSVWYDTTSMTPRAQSGQSQIEHSYKADSRLSEEGRDYARQLYDFIIARRVTTAADKRVKEGKSEEENRKLTVRTSILRSSNRNLTHLRTGLDLCEKTMRRDDRAFQARWHPRQHALSARRDQPWRHRWCAPFFALQRGCALKKCTGMTPEEIEAKYPEMYKNQQLDPWSHRYPRAESYHDLSVRLEPVIFELERDKSDLLIIGHASVLRCLFAYLKGLAPTQCPNVDIRRGDVIEVTPTAYGVKRCVFKARLSRTSSLSLAQPYSCDVRPSPNLSSD